MSFDLLPEERRDLERQRQPGIVLARLDSVDRLTGDTKRIAKHLGRGEHHHGRRVDEDKTEECPSLFGLRYASEVSV